MPSRPIQSSIGAGSTGAITVELKDVPWTIENLLPRGAVTSGRIEGREWLHRRVRLRFVVVLPVYGRPSRAETSEFPPQVRKVKSHSLLLLLLTCSDEFGKQLQSLVLKRLMLLITMAG